MSKDFKKVTKVIIPAAGWGTRFLPFTKIVHKELLPVLNKPIIHYLVEEAIQSGIKEIIFVLSLRKLNILEYFDENTKLNTILKSKNKISLLNAICELKEIHQKIKFTTIIQKEQKGLGHALGLCVKAIDNEPFGVILGDDLIHSKKPVLLQMIEQFNKLHASILGVKCVSDEDINKYGIVKPDTNSEFKNKIVKIVDAVEKPTLKNAPSNLAILGRYIFTPEILPILASLKQVGNSEIDCIDAFKSIMKIQNMYAYEFDGTRYDLGSVYGFVTATIDYALKDETLKDNVIAHIKNKIK